MIYALKSSARIIGAKELSEKAAELEDLFGKINKYSLPDNLIDNIKKIEDAIDNIDFETIANLIPFTEN